VTNAQAVDLSVDPAESDEPAVRGRHGRAARYAILLAIASCAVTPVANVALPQAYALFAMLQSAAIMSTAITALLLLAEATTLRLLPNAVLGAGFAFAGATMLPYTLLYAGLFPGFAQAIGAAPTAPEYLWFFWQAGLLAAVLVYQRLRRVANLGPRAQALGRIAIAGLAVAYFVLTPIAVWIPGLPVGFADGHWTPVFWLFMAPVLLLLAGAIVCERIARRGRASTLDAWVAIVAANVVAEVYLTAIGGVPFTVGWYASRIVVVFTASVVLAVQLARATRTYAELIERAEVLQGEAYTDMLTGLPNRRRFDEEFARAFGSSLRRSSPLSIALIDIDRFKQYNDHFGHQAGDEALRRIAAAIAESVGRSGDVAARYGGEEFVVILEETTRSGAVGVGERIRNAVLAAGIPAPSGRPLSVSVGVAARLPGSTAEELLRQADSALYEAKNAGRNRVISWRSTTIAPIGSAFDDAV
jgi:diguanylate cyclase (GGDEF)-like protein